MIYLSIYRTMQLQSRNPSATLPLPPHYCLVVVLLRLLVFLSLHMSSYVIYLPSDGPCLCACI